MSVAKLLQRELKIDEIKNFYLDINNLQVDNISRLYHSDCVYQDPFTRTTGLEAFHSYLSARSNRLNNARIEFLDQTLSNGHIYLKWNLYVASNKPDHAPIMARGMSQILYNNKIYYHEDLYNLNELIFDHVPILGFATRLVRKNLGNP